MHMYSGEGVERRGEKLVKCVGPKSCKGVKSQGITRFQSLVPTIASQVSWWTILLSSLSQVKDTVGTRPT